MQLRFCSIEISNAYYFSKFLGQFGVELGLRLMKILQRYTETIIYLFNTTYIEYEETMEKSPNGIFISQIKNFISFKL